MIETTFALVKFLLLPFAWLYGLVVIVRNLLYDRHLLSSRSFDIPVVAVGNLRVGGTGKTPMVVYLMKLFHSKQIRPAMVSRGFGRKTSGFRWVNADSDPTEVGDEPLMVKQGFRDSLVAVDERRARGTELVIESDDAPEVVVLDDAMQHRRITPGLLILLTAYHHPYFDDLLLPAGRLREPSFEANRADIIIVTKCPAKLDVHTRRSMKQEIKPMYHQKVFFSYEVVTHARRLFEATEIQLSDFKNYTVFLISGLADPQPMEEMLLDQGFKVKHLRYRDHHDYTSQNITSIIDAFDQLADENKIIFTTEKDAQKLAKWRENEKYASLPIYRLEHAMKFFDDDAVGFEERMDEFIRAYR